MARVTIHDTRCSPVRLVAEHENVPDSWAHDMILQRLGVRPHLEVWRYGELIQRGAEQEKGGGQCLT